MVKRLVVAMCMLSLFGAGIPLIMAAESQPAKIEKKSLRKKKQLMCKECGKPESQCECKGEAHRNGKK